MSPQPSSSQPDSSGLSGCVSDGLLLRDAAETGLLGSSPTFCAVLEDPTNKARKGPI